MSTRSPARAGGAIRCVAVDLGPRFVRVVEVDQSGGEPHIARRGTAALPPNCWNEVSENRDGMAASIKEAMSAAGIIARTAVATIPRRLVTVRFAHLPPAPPDQIRGLIEFEAQQYILFPLNEVVLDYHVQDAIGSGIVSRPDDMQTVLLAAARRSLVADIVAVFDRAGIELTQMSVSALALAEHIRDSLEPTAVIALESGAMDVSVVADGQLLFTRSSALEVAGIAREVAARRFGEEVARSFTAYQNEFRQKPLAHIFLCGSESASADGDWMDQALTEALEKPVSRLHSRLLPTSDPDARSYAIAAGMALEALGGALSDINLVPNDRAEERLRQQQARRKQLAGFAAVAAAATGIFFIHGAMDGQQKRQLETVAANKRMDDAQKAEKPIQRSHDRVAAFDRVLTQSLDRDHPSVDVLVAINRCLPKSTDIWLTQLSFDRGGLMTLRGDSKNSRAVTDLLLNLQASGAFTDVKLSYIADAQDTAGPADVAQVTPRAPVTPLPGLQPAATSSVPGAAVPGAVGAPLGAPGALPGAPGVGAPTFNPGGAGSYNPAAGYNPAGGAGGYNPAAMPGGYPGGFGGGRGGRNRFGGAGGGLNQGANGGGFNRGGGYPGATPGGAGPGAPGAYNFTGQPGVAGQVPTALPAGQTQPVPAGPPPVPGPTVVITPGQPGAPVLGQPSFPAPGQPAFQAPGSGRVVITPDMGASGGGRPAFSPAQLEAWRQYRNRVTGGGAPSSVNVAGSVPGAVPGAPVAGAPAPAAAQRPAAATRKPAAAPKPNKPTLTGFVITCRLRQNAKLAPPDARDVAGNRGAPERAKPAAPVAAASGESDNNDDTGDIE